MNSVAQPALTFFCELEVPQLQALFSDPGVIAKLRDLNAAVSLGLIDLRPERANVVHQLNQAGIPVDAWLLLPKSEGYWFNLDNAPQAVMMYQEFQTWTAEHGLLWHKIGLDIEPDIRLMNSFKSGLVDGLRAFINRFWLTRGQTNPRDIYRALVATIKQDGYTVESYQVPVIADERKVNSRFVQNVSGIVDLKVDREVLMLYSSFARPHGDSILWSYAPDAAGIGLGVTGGGVNTEAVVDSNSMTWAELSRDLLIAARWTQNIYIFSLEGCVAQGFLDRIAAMDWSQPPVVSVTRVKWVDFTRRLLQAFLWLTTRPLLLLGLALAPFILFRRRKGRK